MKQLISPNLTVQGKAGWCLSVAQDVWGTPHLYAKAIDAWNDSTASNHPGEQPPSDVCVPVYWTYTESGIQYGHIATWVPGRGVYSSPFNVSYGAQWFDSIQAVTDRINRIAGANSRYLGWSETLSRVQLVSNTSSGGSNGMAEKITVDTSRILSWGLLARKGIAGRAYSLDGTNGGDGWVGQDLTNAFVQQFFLSDESRQWRDSSDANSINGINSRLTA